MLSSARFILTVLALIRGAHLQLPIRPPLVQLSHGGSLEGTNVYSANGSPIDAFFGVPYAVPPLGALRFRDPQPAPDWLSIQPAITSPPPCVQNDVSGEGGISVIGTEDCLYLNVFTPRDRVNEPVLSVMVYFHGGAFFRGSSDPVVYGPQWLLDRNVILVTVNYRLGPFGFLCTMNKFSPGNYGLKDQNLALKWVQDHISSFGGNPNDVTIFGQSAGAASASLHLIAPSSSGLFHKAILQSGNYFNPWAIVPAEKAVQRAQQLAALVSCPGPVNDNYELMMSCLRDVDAKLLIAKQVIFFVFPTGDPATVFGPVIESESSSAFLPTHPNDITSSYGDEIPVIVGCTADEGAFKSGAIINQYSDEFAASFDLLVPSIAFYDDLSISEQREITQRIKDFYFKKGFDWSLTNSRNLTNVYSDTGFFAGMEQFLKKRRKTARADTYAYIFDHNPPQSSTVLFGAGTNFFGVAHGDELPFLFSTALYGLLYSERDRQMVSTMTRMWTDFAKTGDPTPKKSPVVEKWKRVRGFPYRYALIGSKYLRYTPRNSSKRQYNESEKDTNLTTNLPEENNYSKKTERYSYDVESTEDDGLDMERAIEPCHGSEKGKCNTNEPEYDHNIKENSVTEDKFYNEYYDRRNKRCKVYSKRKYRCLILRNKSNRFWSGFYIRRDSKTS